MKDVRRYIEEFRPPLERLDALLERVQRDAYAVGVRDGGVQLFEIAKERIERGQRRMETIRHMQ